MQKNAYNINAINSNLKKQVIPAIKCEVKKED